MKLTDWERVFLNYYLNKHNAKWIRVSNNRHPFLETQINLYTIYKRKLKQQPVTGETTHISMFKQLVEGQWYFIPDILNDKEEL